ncbi:hypothetical protein ACJX0J_028227, partial [Zea mays]
RARVSISPQREKNKKKGMKGLAFEHGDYIKNITDGKNDWWYIYLIQDESTLLKEFEEQRMNLIRENHKILEEEELIVLWLMAKKGKNTIYNLEDN